MKCRFVAGIVIFTLCAISARGHSVLARRCQCSSPSDCCQQCAEGTGDETQRIAEPMLSNILAGMKMQDYAAYSRDFTKEMLRNIPKETFKQVASEMQKTFGNCNSFTYLGSLQKGDQVLTVWKSKFSNTKSELLIRMGVERVNGQPKVSGLFFQ